MLSNNNDSNHILLQEGERIGREMAGEEGAKIGREIGAEAARLAGARLGKKVGRTAGQVAGRKAGAEAAARAGEEAAKTMTRDKVDALKALFLVRIVHISMNQYPTCTVCLI